MGRQKNEAVEREEVKRVESNVVLSRCVIFDLRRHLFI